MELRIDRTLRMLDADCIITDEEALDLILYGISHVRSSDSVAEYLVDRYGSLAEVCRQPFEILRQIEGVGDAGAMRLVALKQIPQLIAAQNVSMFKRRVTTVSEMYEYIKPFYANERREVLYLLLLSEKFRVLALRKVCEGDNEGIIFDGKTIVTEVIKYGAKHVVLYHNHFINREPSDRDIIVTNKIDTTLNGIDINLADHIIVCGDSYVSMRDLGCFKNENKFRIKDWY